MIYRTLHANSTGQMLVGCPHVPVYVAIEMSSVKRGTLFECAFLSRLIFMPSKKTIVIWCPACYSTLQDLERPTGSLESPLIESESH